MQDIVSSSCSLQPVAQQPRTIITDLPSELLYTFFDRIYSDASSPKAAMKVCRLVCRVFNTHALPHVFRDVRLHLSCPYQDGRVEECVHILEGNPKIAACVQKVTVTLQTENYAIPRRGTELDGIYKNTYLPVILPQFTRIKSFTLKKTRDWILWSKFSKDIITTLEGVFSTASLTSIEIRGIREIPHLDWIRGLTIEKLELSAVAFQNPEKRGSSSGQFNPRRHHGGTVGFPTLKHLILPPYHSLLDKFNNLQQCDERPLSSLQSISLLLRDGVHGEALSRFLDGVSTHLEELDLTNCVSGTACNKCSWPSFDLQRLPFLQKITICDRHCECQWHSFPIDFITVLQCNRLVANVHTLHILLTTDFLQGENLMQRITSRWSAVDAIIQTTYPRLTTFIVEFGLRTSYGPPERPSEQVIREHMQSVLPWITSNKSISLQLIPHYSREI